MGPGGTWACQYTHAWEYFQSHQGSIFWLPDHSFEHQLMIEPTGSFILELVQEACFPTPYECDTSCDLELGLGLGLF